MRFRYRKPICPATQPGALRRGNTLVLAAASMVMIVGFAAFTIDVGYISLTKAQLQAACDSAALAAAMDLPLAVGPGAPMTTAEASAEARESAVQMAAAHWGGGESSIYADGNRDVRFGQYVWDAGSGRWQKLWGVEPYNLVEVTVLRNQGGGGADGALPLFVAPVIGHDTADVTVRSTAAMIPGVGFRLVTNGTGNAEVLPIALDVDTWNDLMGGIGDDDWTYNDETGAITSGGDDILEVNLYPTGNNELPPGNRGTVDFGSPNNSTADLSRQILFGLNEDDLSYFGGAIEFDSLPMVVNGDTGLSAGIKDELEAIKGLPRAIPLFSEVSGPGNNAMYTIVKFVGIRILDVKLTGSPSKKHVTVQPAPFVAPEVIPGEVTTIEPDTLFSTQRLVQ